MKSKIKYHSGWYEITTLPKGMKMNEKLDIGGKTLALIPAHSKEEAADIYFRNHRSPKTVRVFPVRLVKNDM